MSLKSYSPSTPEGGGSPALRCSLSGSPGRFAVVRCVDRDCSLEDLRGERRKRGASEGQYVGASSADEVEGGERRFVFIYLVFVRGMRWHGCECWGLGLDMFMWVLRSMVL
jgi:hypothetical protein